MLKIRQVKHLTSRLGISIDELEEVLHQPDKYCERFLLIDPERPSKPREVLSVTGVLRAIQERVFRSILLPSLSPSPQSHGGVKERHILSNAGAHRNSVFAFTTDISNFYPSISHQRVYRLFRTLDCSPDVCRLLTKLCTYDHHLALGLVTSPLIANQIMRVVDTRITALCATAGLVYTRFVDDITISGPFDLDERVAGISNSVAEIVRSHGFTIQKTKHLFGKLEDGFEITKIRVKDQHFDVSRAFITKLESQLEDARRISRGEKPVGLFYTREQILGRVEFVGWVNPGRIGKLRKEFNSISWANVILNAMSLGLIAARVRKQPLSNASRAEKVPLVALPPLTTTGSISNKLQGLA